MAEDRPLGAAEVAQVHSSRARRLLESAHRHGLDVFGTDAVAECWTIRKPGQRWGGESLTVYGGARNAAHVLYDRGSGSTWDEATQARAFTLIQGMASTLAVREGRAG